VPPERAVYHRPLVLAVLPITQHAAVLFIFLSIFVHLHNESLDPRLVVWTCIIGFFVGYTAWELVQKQQKFPTRFKEQRKFLYIVRSQFVPHIEC
jgi:hypothetical protein